MHNSKICWCAFIGKQAGFMIMSRRRKEPEVVVFKEPTFSSSKKGKEATREREKFLTGDVAQIFNCREEEVEGKAKPQGEEGLDFKATLREVQALAASGTSGKEKRKLEEQQVIALGAKPPKRDCVPYPHLQRMAKARKRKEQQLADQLHLTRGVKNKKKEPKRIKVKGRWQDNLKSLEPAVGRFRGGVLQLSKTDIQKFGRRRR